MATRIGRKMRMESVIGKWSSFVAEAPDLAARVRARFDAAKHHVIATLRADGSPRVSGTEVQFHDGALMAGMMLGSVKAQDLRRDGRYALHTNPGDATMAGGDAKVSGVATEVTAPDALAHYASEVGPPPEFHLFALGVAEVVLTSLHPDGDRLVIETWRPGQGVSRTERA